MYTVHKQYFYQASKDKLKDSS